MEIAPGVHSVDGLIAWPWAANVFLLVDRRLTLVDTGLRGSARAIERYVGRLGRDVGDLELVVLTHHHVDHAGAVAELRRRCRFQVAAHELEIPYLEGRVPAGHSVGGGPSAAFLGLIEPLIRVSPVRVDVPLRDGSELPVAGGVRVIHTPGHTPGSICLYLPAQRLALVGDAFSIKPWGLELPTRVSTLDMDLARSSLERLAELDLEIVCPSHGRPYVGDASQRIRDFLARGR
ncbi:MAG TPA: MBL fold metallo-hydrolase [Chloroflexota bacterium]